MKCKDIDIIKAELERRLTMYEQANSACHSLVVGGVIQGYKEMIAFIKDFPQQPVCRSYQPAEIPFSPAELEALKEAQVKAVKEDIENWKKSVIEMPLHHIGDGFYNLIKESENEQ